MEHHKRNLMFLPKNHNATRLFHQSSLVDELPLSSKGVVALRKVFFEFGSLNFQNIPSDSPRKKTSHSFAFLGTLMTFQWVNVSG